MAPSESRHPAGATQKPDTVLYAIAQPSIGFCQSYDEVPAAHITLRDDVWHPRRCLR